MSVWIHFGQYRKFGRGETGGICLADVFLWFIRISIWKRPDYYLAIGPVWIYFGNYRRFAWGPMEDDCVDVDVFMWFIRVVIWKKNWLKNKSEN